MHNYLMSSELTSRILAKEGKSEAGSYCLVRRYDASDQELQPMIIRYFILIDWHNTSRVDRIAVAGPIPVQTQEEESFAFGQTVFRFHRNVDMNPDNDVWIPVERICRPLILIKTPSSSYRCMWRLVQFQGKLLGTFAESDFWTQNE